MAVLVSDTSVIIDLERGEILETAFGLAVEFAVPDLLFQRELAGPLGERLLSLGLRVEELRPAEVQSATVLSRSDRTLSLPDTFAFALAQARQWTLLTGDAGLRRAAEAHQLEVHGALWVLDKLEADGVCGCERLASALAKTSSHPRCRLPRAEVTRRLTRYRGA
jgi:predicted nucleic acid-binding protein